MAPAAIKAAARLRENPFFVLGLPVTASRMEIEREAQKLLGMLELELATAGRYASPLGWHARTPDLVRGAVAALRDPARRLLAEAWARHATVVTEPDPRATPATGAASELAGAIDDADAGAPGWEDARQILGWSRGAWR
jgi:hypothetical protein